VYIFETKRAESTRNVSSRKLFAFLRRRRRCAARTLARYWSWNSFSKTETFAKADISRHVTHRLTVTQFRLLSMPSSFHRHFVGKTPRNACYSAVAEIRSFGRLMHTSTFSETNWMVELYLNNMVNLRPLTRYINAKLYRQNGERIVDNRALSFDKLFTSICSISIVLYTAWQWSNFVPVFAAILWVKLLEMFVTL